MILSVRSESQGTAHTARGNYTGHECKRWGSLEPFESQLPTVGEGAHWPDVDVPLASPLI